MRDLLLLTVALAFGACACSTTLPGRQALAQRSETQQGSEVRVPRVNARSPEYYVPEDDVGFYINYSGWIPNGGPDGDGERFNVFQMRPKVQEMVARAERVVILSVFLFDSVYAEGETTYDVAGDLADLLLQKKRERPDITIAVILDPSHKAYGRRASPAERKFREAGIDVFYSDLVGGLKRGTFLGVRETAGHVNRVLHRATLNAWGEIGSRVLSWVRIPGPINIDGEPITLEMIYNALLIKANHRKILFTDDGQGGFEALVASANPHNPSAHHVNTAISVRGEPARYVYAVLRKDIAHCISLGSLYSHWHDKADRAYRKSFLDKQLPPANLESDESLSPAEDRTISVRFLTEKEITRDVLRALNAVEPGDEIRIQMFTLSFQPVLNAILRASTVVDSPIRILLDTNQDAFNREKDGTPNRQVAYYLLQKAAKRGGRIEVRWYSTHGEQNHAKIVTISNPKTGKWYMSTGSCNWTGRNMAGVNMESNFAVDGAEKAVREFNRHFDLFWTNGDGNEYSLDYEASSDPPPRWKWKIGDRPFYYSTF